MTVHHVWLLEAVQEVFELTENVVFPAAAETFLLDGVTSNVGVVMTFTASHALRV